MGILELGNEEVPLPVEIVLDTSLLLACREGDDNPCSKAAKKFIQRLGQQIGDYQMVAWLLIPVLQECYHIILSRSLRRSWAALPPNRRPPNWLAISSSRTCWRRGLTRWPLSTIFWRPFP